MKVKRNIQAFIARTQDNPILGNIYKESYRLFTRIITHHLSKERDIEAIYLHRGLSGDEVVYGLSDIDLIIFVSRNSNEESLKRIRSKYLKLARIIPPLRRSLDEVGIYTVDKFRNMVNTVPFYRYRYILERDKWKLLWGKDIRKEIEVDRSQIHLDAYGEIAVWWKSVTSILTNKDHLPGIIQGYTWHKALAECSRIYFLTKNSALIPGRREALEKLKEDFKNEIYLIEMVIRFRENADFFTHTQSKQALLELMTTLITKITDSINSIYFTPKSDTSLELRMDFSPFNFPAIPTGEKPGEIHMIPRLEFHPDVLVPRDLYNWEIVVESETFNLTKLKKFFHALSNDRAWRKLNWHLLWTNGSVTLSLKPLEPWDAVRSPFSDPILLGAIQSRKFLVPFPHTRLPGEVTFSLPNRSMIKRVVQSRGEILRKILAIEDLRKMDKNRFSAFFWSSMRLAIIKHQLEKEDRCIKIPLTHSQIIREANNMTKPQSLDNLLKSSESDMGNIIGPRNMMKAIEVLREYI